MSGRLREDDFELLIEALWDKGWELYPEICWPVPNVEIRDAHNGDKQLAYRRGCCDAIDAFSNLLWKKRMLDGGQSAFTEKQIELVRQNNGL